MAAMDRDDARRIHDAAFAVRIGMADEKSWIKFAREVMKYG